MNNMEFVKEITTKVFDTSLFDRHHAYMCTYKDPFSDVTHTIAGILRYADNESLTFITADPTRDIRKISIDDAPNWTIERMIEPMSEEELDFLKELLTTYAAHASVFSPYNGCIDSIMKKLGFKVGE